MILATPTQYYDFEKKQQKQENETGFWFKMFFICGLCLFFISCASKPEKQFTYAPTANPTDEIRNLQTEMTRAEGEQIAVFAPDSYARAQKSLTKSKSLQEKGNSNAKVLEELGDARAFFEQAKEVAARSQKALPEVASSRENALIAGANLYDRRELQDADDKLKDLTQKFEKKNPSVSVKENVDLQSRYQNLELKSIKTSRLGDAQSKIAGARKEGAERYAPRSLALAENKLKSAEMTINTDRHNDALITSAASEANYQADKLLKVTNLSKKTGKTGNEGLAIGIVERDEQLSRLTQQREEEAARLRAQQAQSEQQQAATQAALEERTRLDHVYQDARERFSQDEAEVYRQGNNLILRLRGIKFPSGRAEVPTSSFETLAKVRDVIQNMNAHYVTVEGHTDATGGAAVNRRLSEKRAEAVAEYLRPQVGKRSGASEEVQIETHGYGFEHPLSSNKTEKGRALNRRVDVIISPETSIQ